MDGTAGRPVASVIVFDLDDTLYLERDFVRSGFAAVDRWVNDRFAISGFFDRAWGLFEAGRRGDIFDRVLVELTARAGPEIIRELVDVYRGHAPSIRLAPDAEEMLAALYPRRRAALLTDGLGTTQARKVAALGLSERLRPIIYTDELGSGMQKPHPQGFLAIQNEFGLPAREFVYIADNPSKDFLGPRGLDWKTVRVRRPEGQYAHLSVEPARDADRTVKSLTELDLADL
jgi:putative hydrolase of the HAD superfamily